MEGRELGLSGSGESCAWCCRHHKVDNNRTLLPSPPPASLCSSRPSGPGSFQSCLLKFSLRHSRPTSFLEPSQIIGGGVQLLEPSF